MFAVDAGYPAVTVAHVFAKTDIRDRDKLGTFLFDGAQRFLNDAVLRVSPACLFVFLVRNSEKQNGLKSNILCLVRLIDHFIDRELKNARHAWDRAPLVDFVTDEKRQDEVVRGQIRFAHQISERG